MRNYQRKKNNPYLLPDDVYGTVIKIIRGYERRKSEYQELLYPPYYLPDGTPKGNNVSDPTARIGIRRAKIIELNEALEQSLLLIPENYRGGVWENVFKEIPLRYLERDKYPCKNTLSKYRGQFIYNIAKRLNLI